MRVLPLAWLILTLGTAGCALPGRSPTVLASNPLFVPGTNEDAVWERVIDVLHDYPFEVDRESRQDGIIETSYKAGSSILEPWHRESVGAYNRVESTLQSIRRKALLSIARTDGGYLIAVQAIKELEDLPGLAANSIGGATFQQHTPLQRDLNLVVGQTTPSGWILLGRDVELEQDMLERLVAAFSP